MTLNTNQPKWAKPALIIAAILVVIGIWLYLSGAIFMAMAKLNYKDATPLTLWYYWTNFGWHLKVKKYIYLSAGLGFVPFAVFAAIMLKPSRRSLHGEARFAKQSEIRKAGLLGDKGIIVGQYKKQYLMLPGQLHVLLAAPTRSGKGVGCVIPNLLNWPDSVVVLDIKQENFNFTSGFRAKHGQECFLFNPDAADYRTHRWNPLGYIDPHPDRRVRDIQKIAQMLFPDQDGQDPIWSASSRSLFLGVVLFIMETPAFPLTMGEVLRQVTGAEEAGKYFKRMINDRENSNNRLSTECIGALADFIGTSDNTRTSIRKTFTSRLELWFNGVIDEATSANDFDLADLRKKRMSLYIGITPDNLARLQPIINLLFQQIIDINTRTLPESDPSLKYQVLLLMDEFTSIGKINILSKGISYIAGYGLRMLPIIQSPSQLKEVYGQDAARTFITNHHLRIAYTPADPEDAEEIGKYLGNETFKSKSTSKPSGMGKGNRSVSESDQRRALMLPQELMMLGFENEIVLYQNNYPIQCNKIIYHQDETFISRFKTVSPSLRALGDAIPTRKQLETAMLNGELRADVPIITIKRIERPTGEISLEEEPVKTVTTERPIEATDLSKLDNFTLDDFSLDFSKVDIPGDAATSPEEMERQVEDLLAALGYN